MHKLLQRQIRETFGSRDGYPRELADFLELVDDAYHRAGDDRRLLESSLELTSQELLQANAELRARSEALEHQLHQSQKMEAVGRLAGGVAHDFNNLLTAIIGYGDLLANKLAGRSDCHAYLEQIQVASGRGADLVRQLLAFSRQQVLNPKVISLNRVVSDIEKLLGRVIGEDVRLLTELDPDLGSVLADPNQIEQVLLNLAVNGREAMPEGGKLFLRTRSASEASPRPESCVVLEIQDTGVGIEEANLDQIFEPFYTTKSGGTGLGLATVYGIVQQSGGEIRVDSTPGTGTTFTIVLPRHGPAPSAERASADQQGPPPGTEKILLVEDEATVRDLLGGFLSDHGYSVHPARNGMHGLDVFARQAGEIDLLLTDVVMPEMGGLELTAHLREALPELKVLFISGYSERQGAVLEQLGTDVGFLQKPFTPVELAHKVRDVLDS